MEILLKHYNIKKEILNKILLFLLIIDIIQLLLVFIIFNIFLIIIIELILHYILLYYIVHICIFGGSSSLITKYNCWLLGLKISKKFSEELENFKDSLKGLYSNNNQQISNINELYNKSSTLSSINDLIYSYLKLSNASDENKISSFQKNMVVCLNRLKMTIEESNLSKIVSEATVRFNRNKKFEIKSEKLDKSLDKMIDDIDKINEQIKFFQLKGNLWSNIINFLKNDSFGSLIQLKNEILSSYNCEPFKVNIKDTKISLDCLLIKNNEKVEKKEKSENKENKDKPEKFERRVRKRLTRMIDIKEIKTIPEVHFDKEEDKDNEESKDKGEMRRENSMTFSVDSSSEEQKEKNKSAILICNKSSYPYELSVYYDRWIEYYLSWNINVVIYNYRGYGQSNGFSTISNMQTDAEEIIEYIKNKYNFTNIGVHGINLGGIPASYLCSQNKVNFCFVDRCFGSLYEFIKDLTFENIKYVLKGVFLSDCDIVQLLNSSLKRKKNSSNVYKLISYDLKKEFINHNISLRTKMAKDFYNKLTRNNDKREYILDTILEEEKDREYDCFENDIFYVLEKIINTQNESKDYRLELNSIMESVNFKSNTSLTNTSDMDSQISNIETVSPFEKELRKEGDKQQELKIITSIQHLFEKFDAGGETLLSLYKTNDSRKNILNNFFVNLLAWGSYKIGGKYATDLIVAYNAIVKKFPYVNKRIEKILNNPQKYVISDGILTSSLKTVLECLTKIQKFYEDNFLSNKNKNIEIVIDDPDNDDDDADKDKNATNMGLNLPETSINELIKQDNEKKNIIDLINEINIGNLFVLNCGNEGLYSSEEIQMLFMFLINSNFINAS